MESSKNNNGIYKDSGQEWIGQIPIDWKLSKIAALYGLRNEKVSDKDYPPLSVTMKGVVPQLESAAKTDNGDNRKLVKVGDFAINSRSDRRGSCGISKYDGSVSLINTVLYRLSAPVSLRRQNYSLPGPVSIHRLLIGVPISTNSDIRTA